MTALDWPPERTQTPSLIGALGLLLTVAAFGLVAGIPGALASIALVPLWLLLPGIYVVAMGHVLIAAFVGDLSVVSVLAVEVGLLFVLADAASQHARPGSLISNTVFAAGVLVAMVALVLVFDGTIWIAAGVLLVALAAFAYGLHRYELVSLGVIHNE